jgi:hypothetical protein
MAKILVASTIRAARCYKRSSGIPIPQSVPMTLGPFTGCGKLSTTLLESKTDFKTSVEYTLTFNRPDHCDGGFDQFCDFRRKYSNISLILVDSGRGDLLDYMSEYWKDYNGDDATLWEHEWNKHGTCVSTLEPHCYEDYLPQQEVVDYFDKAVEIYQQRSSYKVRLTLLVHTYSYNI